jgi:hypothetical protein
MFCLNYFKHSPGANCIEDLDEILTQINDTQSSSDIPQVLINPTQNIFNLNSIKIGTVAYRNLNIPNQNCLTYICGYLMKKCFENHVCSMCTEYAHFQKSLDPSFFYLSSNLILQTIILILCLEN